MWFVEEMQVNSEALVNVVDTGAGCENRLNECRQCSRTRVWKSDGGNGVEEDGGVMEAMESKKIETRRSEWKIEDVTYFHWLIYSIGVLDSVGMIYKAYGDASKPNCTFKPKPKPIKRPNYKINDEKDSKGPPIK
ncbi:hypothetical protein DEO72_LG11g1192 [Vigna unguiculata]|uniref:Uncharacterized protein n=1 Tax=Vigna unguiculata TaxID=3917 RepID=A0A4D6NK88_VIGUN|nr:hypothetical protein DEO72_LG11g1192 [Vigna unguiculata]